MYQTAHETYSRNDRSSFPSFFPFVRPLNMACGPEEAPYTDSFGSDDLGGKNRDDMAGPACLLDGE
jgi:hypothetical protein